MPHQQTALNGIFSSFDPASTNEMASSIDQIAEGIRSSQMPPVISKSKADNMVVLVKSAVADYMRVAIKAQEAMPEIGGRVASARSAVLNDFNRIIKGRVEPAVAKAKAGTPEVEGTRVLAGVPSNFMKGNIALMLNSIAGGYKALAFFEEIRPGFLFVPGMGTVVKIAEAFVDTAVAVSDALKKGLKQAQKGANVMMEMLKWGTLAGGFYLLYKTMQPEEGP